MRSFVVEPARESALHLAQHQPLNIPGFAGFVIAVDHYRAQPDIACGGFEAYRHAVEELVDHEFFLHADHAVIGTGHANVGDVGGSLGKNLFVGCGHVGVRAYDCRYAAVEIPAQGNLLGSCLGVEVHENYLGGIDLH